MFPQPLSVGYATNDHGWKVPYGGAKYDPDAKKKAAEKAYLEKKKEDNTIVPEFGDAGKDGFFNKKIDGTYTNQWTALAQGLDDKPPTVDLPKPEKYPLPLDIHQATNDNGYKIPWRSMNYDPYAKPDEAHKWVNTIKDHEAAGPQPVKKETKKDATAKKAL